MDVALDLRADSPTFGQAHVETLSAENQRQMWIPAGFGHGFLALEDDSLVLYKCTARWRAEGEAGIWPLDPDLGIQWPLFVDDILLSEKDAKAQTFKAYAAAPIF